ncbi:lipid A export permease/ATP-binding protein MsbA [Rhizobacter sp. Root404]|uniref:lipid A export permease/ATP-binding protein MsbA n=1 Tax=Rhizobacter sp. Root404 TaxID=1736528 RepID=UPI0006FD8D4B|nr:lipid A export permease/ATP-binding protein MsbA [Rhizobacter sp. Root404]KQW37778.1 lipid A export permease/ATP-binding protein MsbA [Rhizobacter sp. Root404]
MSAEPVSRAGLWTKLRVLFPYFAGTRWAFGLAALGAAFAAVCETGVAWLLVPLVDGGMKAIPIKFLADLPHPPLWAIPVALVVLFALRGAAGFVVDYTLAWAANAATLRLRSHLFGRLLDGHPQLFVTRSASSLMNTVVYEVLGGVNQLVGAAQTLLKDTFSVIAFLGTMLLLNWKLTLVIAALGPAVGYVMRVFGKRMHRITKESQVAVDRLGYVVEENVMAWRTVRLHGVQDVQRARFEDTSQALRRLLMKSTVAGATVTPVTQLLTATALAAAIGMALWQSSTGGTTMGAFVAFITAAVALATPMRRLSDVSAPISRGIASVERALDLIHHAPTETGGTHAPGRARGELALRGVSIRFGDNLPALDRISLDIRAGETVALVGPSGAGKSTLVNLLPRFLDPDSGTITLDGVALPQWSLHALREQFALVSQDVVLFNDTVAANVCFGAPVDAARTRAALAAANLDGFVDGLPLGVETVIGHNGTQLSGGQRQRLAIARAIYKDAPILILDEATSALDSESERLVQQALEALMKGRTSLVIAHRLSTIERADRIIALEAGRVIEQGSHAELLAHGGLYARLHALQFRS